MDWWWGGGGVDFVLGCWRDKNVKRIPSRAVRMGIKRPGNRACNGSNASLSCVQEERFEVVFLVGTSRGCHKSFSWFTSANT